MSRTLLKPGTFLAALVGLSLGVGACARPAKGTVEEAATAVPPATGQGKTPAIPTSGAEAVELIPTGLESPVDFQVADDAGFYLLGSNELLHLARDGRLLDRRQFAGAASALTITDNDILVAMNEGIARVPRADLQREMTLVALPRGAMVTGIAVNQEDIYVADSAGRGLLRIVGGEVLPFPLVGVDGQAVRLVVPSPYLDVRTGEGKMFMVNNPGAHQLLGFSPGGVLAISWGEPGSEKGEFCGCCGPISFDVLPDGRVVTAEKGCRRVQLFEADGRWVSVVADGRYFAAADRICDLRGIDPIERWLQVRSGPDGTIWVLERCTGDLLRFAGEMTMKSPAEESP